MSFSTTDSSCSENGIALKEHGHFVVNVNKFLSIKLFFFLIFSPVMSFSTTGFINLFKRTFSKNVLAFTY